MRYRKSRRFRHRSSGRNHQSHNNGGEQMRHRSTSFSNERGRNNMKLPQGAEKLAEKYNALAKEALSSGDRVLAESYFQYADHFLRIIDERKLNQNQSVVRTEDEKKVTNKNLSHNFEFNQDRAVEEKKE